MAQDKFKRSEYCHIGREDRRSPKIFCTYGAFVDNNSTISMKHNLISTRDSAGDSELSLHEAILTSQPSDGGLFVFPEMPKLELSKLIDLDFRALAKTILGQFDFGIPKKALDAVIDEAYGSQWDTSEIIPVTPLWGKNFLLELYHGPTQAFKDIALQFLPRVLSRYRREGEVMRALGASSGDTISAAHFGVGDVAGLQSIFLLPAKGPSEIQLLQAVANGFHNVMTILIEGSFDDGQRIIKTIMSEERYRDIKYENNFISFNSINIARILAQIVYYIYAYLELVRKQVIPLGDPINFSVPSGNFGDALAGVYAREMGAPIQRLNVATNKNDILHRFLETGEYRPGDQLQHSLAPSQDIATASNFERMLFLIFRDPARVSQLMKELKMQASFRIEHSELEAFRRILTSSSASDDEIDAAIRYIFQKTGKVIDPHTATGVHGGLRIFGENPELPTVFLATADHIKFPQPEGVMRGEARYQAIVSPLRARPPVFLRSAADEASVIAAIREAVQRIG